MLRTIVNSASLPTVDESSASSTDLKPLLVDASQLEQWQDCVTGKRWTPFTTTVYYHHLLPPFTTVYYHRLLPLFTTTIYHCLPCAESHTLTLPFLFSLGGRVDQRQERAGVDHGPKERQRIGGTATTEGGTCTSCTNYSYSVDFFFLLPRE